jgi:NNP family nitrate/nitrite transporter-like MFS transporter
MTALASLPALAAALTLMLLLMGLLGAGNGIVFQLIPQRFQREIGVVTGIVGAAGGVGGFFLPSVLGLARELTGSFSPGLAAFAVASLAMAGVVWSASRAWIAPTALEPAVT